MPKQKRLSTTRSEELLKYAKRYIELGFSIHPCCPVSHVCSSPGKIPYDPVGQGHMENWQSHGMPTIHEVEEWIGHDSSINLGFLCGSPSNLICIDIDTSEGLSLYQSYAATNDPLTWEFKTGNGRRFLYAMPPDMEHFSSLNIDDGQGGKLEILGDGKQTVAPPSEHPNGKIYEWLPDYSPQAMDIALAPSWLTELRPLSSAEDDVDWGEAAAEGILEGGRNVGIAKLAGHMLAPQPLPPKEVLFWMRLYNAAKCKPPLPDRELVAIIKSIAKREGRQVGSRTPEELAEIKRIMKDYSLPWRDAEMMWKGMG